MMKNVVVVLAMCAVIVGLVARLNSVASPTETSSLTMNQPLDIPGALEGLVLVDFYADWCRPCRAMNPILAELSAEIPDLKILKVNVDHERELAARFSVSSIPYFVLVKDNLFKGDVLGGRSKAEMKAFVDARR